MNMTTVARFGFATKGTVYALIGILAIMAAFGLGGQTTGSRGALREIAEQPFGEVLLILLGLGLAAFALWRVFEIGAEPFRETGTKRTLKKALCAISAIIHGSLALYAAQLLASPAQAGSDGSTQQALSARLLALPFGQALLALIGLAIMGGGLYEIYRGFSANLRDKLALNRMTGNEARSIMNISRFGIAARGFVFCIIGAFVVQAAAQYDPGEVRGLDGALATLANQPYGQVLLVATAAGLVAYAVYMLVRARYGTVH